MNDRLTILSKIRQMVGDSSVEGKVNDFMLAHHIKDALIFCYEDGELLPDAGYRQRLYKHNDHICERAYIFFPTTRWEFTDIGELRHYTAGAILWRQDDDETRYCLFRRRIHPVGFYTIPAGHIEMGESLEEAVLREIYEETRLSILSVKFLLEEEIRDECRRGADYHYWYLFCCQAMGDPQISDEADVIGWYTQFEIINKLNLTLPTGHFLGQFFDEIPLTVRES